ncbi:hypothetical protein C8A03DRAFT_37324, partial [Achaetomium macrosporum]
MLDDSATGFRAIAAARRSYKFASAWKRRKDAQAATISENPQLQNPDVSPVQDGNDGTDPLAPVEKWLFSAQFNDTIESPPDTPSDQELDELADLPPPAPDDETDDSNTLTTVKSIQQELVEAEQDGSVQNLAEEPTLPASDFSDNLTPSDTQEDVGFEDPDEQEVGPSMHNDTGAEVDVLLDAAELDDPSEPVHHSPRPFNMSPFLFAFALWEKKHNISRT